MKNVLNWGVGLIAVLALVFSLTSKPVTIVKEVLVGSGSGQDISSRQFFQQGATFGGFNATTSAVTLTTYTTNQRDFANQPTVVSWNNSVNTTLSISSTSTLAYVPNVGDTATIYWRNASTTAGATQTFAAKDSGVDMQFSESTGGDLVLNGLDWAKITFIHTETNKVTVLFDEMTEAD